MIHKTTEYKIFKKNQCNREINTPNLIKIKNSIVAKNLLYLRPIIVNKNMEIMDGQHRLEAARILELPIFYQVNEEIETEDIVLLNDNQRGWKLDDYTNFYANQNNIEYIKLQEYSKQNKLPIQFIVKILANSHGKAFMRFRRGEFKFPTDISVLKNNFFGLNEITKIINE